MNIDVAGAGAGKTTRMASRILEIDASEGKIVYCVAFTNAATENIKKKLVELNGIVPENVRVSTIHSFLYTEIIQPFYHLLYGVRFKGISTINLSNNLVYRNSKLRDLEGQQLLHQIVIPQKAKWVVDKKSSDNKRTRDLRAGVLSLFGGYCKRIIVDEAQDINKEIRDVLLALDRAGIDIELSGDPKQDVKGYGCFREAINMFSDVVSYSDECYRCPQSHLQLSNRLACENEQQVAHEGNCEGCINVFFESETDVAELISHQTFGLAYISKKNDRFDTHATVLEDGRFDTIFHELCLAIGDKRGARITDLKIKRDAYYITRQMIAFVDSGGEVPIAINRGIQYGYYDYDNRRYAAIAQALDANALPNKGTIVVSSIEAIKGLEHEKCLFILTRDLAPYLMGDKTDDNRTSHLLYVALTRSLDNLTILVTTEVEKLYSRIEIMAAFG